MEITDGKRSEIPWRILVAIQNHPQNVIKIPSESHKMSNEPSFSSLISRALVNSVNEPKQNPLTNLIEYVSEGDKYQETA